MGNCFNIDTKNLSELQERLIYEYKLLLLTNSPKEIALRTLLVLFIESQIKVESDYLKCACGIELAGDEGRLLSEIQK